MSKFCTVASTTLATALLMSLTGCGGGGGGSSQANPPPPSAPAPPPAPVPDPVPPLASVVVDLDDNHAIGVDRWDSGNTATGGQGADVAGLPCLLNMPDAYHVHSHLTIYVDGVAQAVPANVGIAPTQPARCFYPIHTHDKSGKIHVEAAAPGTYTLGQLFQIWGQPLETDNVAGITGKPIVVYSTENATVTKVTTDWKAIELTTHKEITVQIGTAITEIPNYHWSSN
jgi:hypothetical protein